MVHRRKKVHKKSPVLLNLEYKKVINFRIVDRKFIPEQTKPTMYIPFADINDLSLPKTCNVDFPDPDDLLTFKLIICPDEGKYSFCIEIRIAHLALQTFPRLNNQICFVFIFNFKVSTNKGALCSISR